MKIAVRMVLSILVAVVLATPILFATVPAPAGKQQDMLLKDAAKSTPRVSQAEESREEPPKEGASIVEPLKTTATVAPQPNPFLSLFLLAVSVALGLAAYGLAKSFSQGVSCCSRP